MNFTGWLGVLDLGLEQTYNKHGPVQSDYTKMLWYDVMDKIGCPLLKLNYIPVSWASFIHNTCIQYRYTYIVKIFPAGVRKARGRIKIFSDFGHPLTSTALPILTHSDTLPPLMLDTHDIIP